MGPSGPTSLFEELEGLPDICVKCHRNLVAIDSLCVHCYVEDGLDLELIYEQR